MVGAATGPETNLLVKIFQRRSKQVAGGGAFPCENRQAVRGLETGDFQEAQRFDGE